MTYATYLIIRQIVMGIVIFLGAHMLFVRLPEQIKGSFFQKSLRVMGAAFMIVPASCFLYTNENHLDTIPRISTAISLTAYYFTFMMMSIAFLILLGKKYTKTQKIIANTMTVLYPVPMWVCICFCSPDVVDTAISASYSYFLIMVVIMVSYVLFALKQAKSNIENFYSDDMLIYVNWISKSVALLIGLAVTCLIAPLFFSVPRWLRLVFMTYGVLCYLHIYYGYHTMLINLTRYFTTREFNFARFASVEQSGEPEESLSTDVQQAINSLLNIWIENKGFLTRGITIKDVTKEVNTNRTYLSRYINGTYGCTFKTWITQLRIEEAKRILSTDYTTPLSSISLEIGFASVASFTHIFTRLVGVSPAKWREEQCEKNSYLSLDRL